jgi:hypothetical protein
MKRHELHHPANVVAVAAGKRLSHDITLGATQADNEKIAGQAETFAITTVAGALRQTDLVAGEEAQEVTVYLKTLGAGAAAQINGAFVGGTKITLDTAGEFFRAKSLNGSWVILNNTGVLA